MIIGVSNTNLNIFTDKTFYLLNVSAGLGRRIVDLVSTGATLKANGLKEIDEIMKIQSKLIINRSAFKTNNKQIQSIMDEFKSLIK